MNKFTTPKPKKLIPPTPSAGRARPQPPFPFFPFLVLVFLIIIVFGVRLGLRMSGKYLEGTEGYVYLDEDGNPQVIPEVREQLKRQKQNREDCVQYAAVATEEGYRACYSCPVCITNCTFCLGSGLVSPQQSEGIAKPFII